MKLSRKNRIRIKVIGFLLMVLTMVLLNNMQQESSANFSARNNFEIIGNINDKGITPGSVTIPTKTEGDLPLRLISKPNSNFLMVLNNCQHFSNAVKFQLLQKTFLQFCTRIHYNFITEYLATIRNKDYK